MGNYTRAMTEVAQTCWLWTASAEWPGSVVIAGMVQKPPFSGNTRGLSADPDRSRVGAGLRDPPVDVLRLQFRENRVYPRSSSQ